MMKNLLCLFDQVSLLKKCAHDEKSFMLREVVIVLLQNSPSEVEVEAKIKLMFNL